MKGGSLTEEDGRYVSECDKKSRIFLIPDEGELREFFEKLLASGSITVVDGDRNFLVRMSPSSVTANARNLLAGGGPISD